MYSGAVWVWPARLPETRIVDPNSPTARANVSSAPPNNAPRKLGSVTCQKVCQRVAPIVADASSSELLIVSNTGLITPNASGNVTKMFARMIAVAVNIMSGTFASPMTRESVPYGPQSNRSAKPATAVGIAVGSEIVTIRALRPQKLYFERTYAANRPNRTLKTVAQKLVTIDSFNAKIASGSNSAFQKLWMPFAVPKINIEASGRSTSGSMTAIITVTLSGFITSKPRVCRIPERFVLISRSVEPGLARSRARSRGT